jgi:hypothetical protein
MRSIYLILFLCCFACACKERYGLPMDTSLSHSLVVEGNILKGDSTVIRLSRTTAIGEPQIFPESGATVRVEGDDNNTYTLFESEPGVYKTAPIELNSSTKYRLTINAAGKAYESEWTSVINTADIDTVYWQRANGVEIFIKSSGTADDSRYYKWDYEEVWDFYSKYKSYAYFTSVGVNEYGQPVYQCIDKVVNGTTYTTCIERYDPLGLTYNDSIYHCWKYDNSSSINIGSTAALTDNVAFTTVRKIEENGFELANLYSILVKQTGLSKESYEFYQILKGNTESLGTIFDAQPDQLKTNLTCVTDPREVVIGFVNATSVKSKRIFISNSEIGDWHYDPFSCIDTSFLNNEPDVANALGFSQIPVNILESEQTEPYRILSYSTSASSCVDCRTRGVHRKPDFWPY